MKWLSASIGLCAVTVQAWAGDQVPVQSAAAGSLDISFEETQFRVSLAVPSEDILGFDHRAADDADRSAVADAISSLSKPLTLFVVPEQAGCATASANVSLTGEGLGSDADTQGAPEFLAEYVIQCSDMAALDMIEFAYFERFDQVSTLDITASSQGVTRRVHVTSQSPVLDVSALHGAD